MHWDSIKLLSRWGSVGPVRSGVGEGSGMRWDSIKSFQD